MKNTYDYSYTCCENITFMQLNTFVFHYKQVQCLGCIIYGVVTSMELEKIEAPF